MVVFIVGNHDIKCQNCRININLLQSNDQHSRSHVDNYKLYGTWETAKPLAGMQCRISLLP